MKRDNGRLMVVRGQNPDFDDKFGAATMEIRALILIPNSKPNLLILVKVSSD
jgi:hypothetical protein